MKGRLVILICTLFLLGVPMVHGVVYYNSTFDNLNLGNLFGQDNWGETNTAGIKVVTDNGVEKSVKIIDAVEVNNNHTLGVYGDYVEFSVELNFSAGGDTRDAAGLFTIYKQEGANFDAVQLRCNAGEDLGILKTANGFELLDTDGCNETAKVNITGKINFTANTGQVTYGLTGYQANFTLFSASGTRPNMRITGSQYLDTAIFNLDNLCVADNVSECFVGGGDTTPPLVDVAVNDTDITCGQHIYMNATFYDETHLNWSWWWVLNSSFDTIWYDYGPPLNSNMSRSYNYTSLISYGTGTWWLYANATDQSENTNQTYVTFSVSEACDLWSPIFNESLIGLNRTINAGESINYKCNTTDVPPVKSYPINHTLNDTSVLSINIATCSITSGAMAEGTYWYNLTITDDSGNFDYNYFRIIVNPVVIENVVLNVSSPTNTTYDYMTTTLNINFTQFNATNCSYILDDIWHNLTGCNNATINVSQGNDYNLTVSAENVTTGHIVRKYISFSVNSAGGLTDEEHDWLEAIYEEVSNMWMIAPIIMIASVMGLFAYYVRNLNEEHNPLKFLFIVGSFLMGVVGLRYATLIAEENSAASTLIDATVTLYRFSVIGFWVVCAYFMVYFIMKVLSATKLKRNYTGKYGEE